MDGRTGYCVKNNKVISERHKGLVLVSIECNKGEDYLEKIQLICKALGKVHINLKERNSDQSYSLTVQTGVRNW